MIDESILEQAKRITWRAERFVDALKSGMHRSRLFGSAGEFSEHREYERGDDPRHLDWRAFARTGKPMMRRFEHAAERRATLVLDRSASMNWSGFSGAGESKQERAATLLLTLGLVLQGQGDRVGVVVIDEEKSEHSQQPTELRLAPTRSRDELLRFTQVFATPGIGAPAVADSLEALCMELRDRHLLVIATDALDLRFVEGTSPFSALLGSPCELHLLHLLHSDERAPTPRKPARFEGLEGEASVELELSQEVIARYQARLSQLETHLETHVTEVGGLFHSLDTGQDPVLQLAEIVARRAPRRRS